MKTRQPENIEEIEELERMQRVNPLKTKLNGSTRWK